MWSNFPSPVIPFSTSPDGKTAVYYRIAHPTSNNPESEFYLLSTENPSSSDDLSAKSLCSLEKDFTETNPNQVDPFDDKKLLLDQIAGEEDGKRVGARPDLASSYYINWSADSRWISIDGGAHKFEKLIVYHWDGTNCSLIHLPNWEEKETRVRKSKSKGRVEKLEVEKRIQQNVGRSKSSNNFIESSYACWVGNGVIAYSTYPTICDLMHHSEENTPENTPPYFLINCATKPKATIEGFAK